MNRQAPPGATSAIIAGTGIITGTGIKLNNIALIHGATAGNTAARNGPIAGHITFDNGDGFGDNSDGS